ncbi:hypothetical protein [Paenirhodobacter populi]|uniref:Phage tail assembly chaperone n=1 Tax=Paenirhodobacter populi TaxID=2306993 RepID=A0A443JKU5_9RHOB|nr:hypothetical protein [Sinirhodobacter populi]RWR21140.1 hypothetical protein D2T30_09865 [Sinirhodobacter populi]
MPAITPAPEVLLRHGPHAVTLRASLRAAVALDSQEGGMGGLYDQIGRFSLTAIKTVIRCACTDKAEAERLLTYASTQPLLPFMLDAQAACLAIMQVILLNNDDTQTGEAIPLRDYYADLFRCATGWLGWTPSEVWTASLAEIEAAMNAHCDRLIAASPDAERPPTTSAKQRAENIAAGLDPEFDRAALHALKARHQ